MSDKENVSIDEMMDNAQNRVNQIRGMTEFMFSVERLYAAIEDVKEVLQVMDTALRAELNRSTQ